MAQVKKAARKGLLVEKKKVDLAEKKVDLVEKKAAEPTAALEIVADQQLEATVFAMTSAKAMEIAAVTTSLYASAKKADLVEKKELLVGKKVPLAEKRGEPVGALPTSRSRDAVKGRP